MTRPFLSFPKWYVILFYCRTCCRWLHRRTVIHFQEVFLECCKTCRLATWAIVKREEKKRVFVYCRRVFLKLLQQRASFAVQLCCKVASTVAMKLVTVYLLSLFAFFVIISASPDDADDEEMVRFKEFKVRNTVNLSHVKKQKTICSKWNLLRWLEAEQEKVQRPVGESPFQTLEEEEGCHPAA